MSGVPVRAVDGVSGFHLLFASNPLPMWIYDLETLQFLEVNDAAAAQYGYARDEFLGLTILDIRPAEDVPRVRDHVAAGRPRLQASGMWRHRRKDGAVIDVDIVSHTLDFGGRAASLVVVRDITLQKRAEREIAQLLTREQAARAAVEEARERLAFLAEASRELASSLDHKATLATVARLAVPTLADWCAVDVVDEHGAIVRVATAHTDPAKVALAEELVRRYPPDWNAPHGVPKVLRTGKPELYPTIPEAMLAEGARDAEHLRLLRTLGMQSAMVLPLVAREGIAGTLTFVSAESGRHYMEADLELGQELAFRCALAVGRAQLYRDVQALNAELERRVAERTTQLGAANKELEAFSYSVAHDLRAPLRTINGFSQALLEDYQGRLDDTGQGFLFRIRRATQQMERLIDDLLSLSRLSRAELRRRPVDLTTIAERVVRSLRQGKPDRPVAVTIAPGLTADGDDRLLEAVFENLLGNAWKFTRDQPLPQIEVGVIKQAGGPVVFVRDNGAGFDMAYSHKLFAPFQRLHTAAEFEGTGIGLAIVQRIVNRHGGRAWAEGEVGKGATVYFTLQ
ncbi:MAG TPA: ATP-binding protein [bacterium]|nr:ATP-binding protein [bacterium]